MDNLDSQKSQAIRGTGAQLLFLPPHNPDLNPIEQAFSTCPHWMRTAAARTPETIWRIVIPVRDRFTPQACAIYFGNAGCASVKP